MTSPGQKMPFPMPTTGTLADQHPFAIGIGGLALSENVYLKEGMFCSRDGLVAMDPNRRWFERLSLADNIVPDSWADGSESPVSVWEGTSGFIVVASSEEPLAADAAYQIIEAGGPVGEGEVGKWLKDIEAVPGMTYSGWILVKGPVQEVRLSFLDDADELLESFDMPGVISDDFTVFRGTGLAPTSTVRVTIAIIVNLADFEDDIHMAAPKIIEDEDENGVYAWSRGDGYAGTQDDNLLGFAVVHPEDGAEANTIWSRLEEVEEVSCYTGTPVQFALEEAGAPLIYDRSLAFSTWAVNAGMLDYGIELNEDYRVTVSEDTDYKISICRTYERAGNILHPSLFAIEVVYYDDGGSELSFDVIDTSSSPVRGVVRDTVTTPTDTVALGLRIYVSAPSASEAYYAVLIDDLKIVESSGAGTEWYDFVPEVIEYGGPTGASEYPLNYMLYDYLFEGATTANRIVMASNGSLWLWDETEQEFQQIGFDLATVYSPFYQTNLEDTTLESRITFVETDDEGYTRGAGEAEQLEVEIEMPKADEGSTSPYPAGWWRYRVNGGDWSDKYTLWDDDDETDPVLTAEIEYNSRTLPIEITLSTDDFLDVCQNTEENPITENPIFKGTISPRIHDGQAGETCLRADRDTPVTMRGYDYAQKTNLVVCNANDKVVVWDGQAESKVARAGSNAPFAKTIAVAGGRVLAGNVRFDDPYEELILPLGVVYTDTYLSKGFNLWHPELAIRLADTPGEIVNLTEMGSMMVAAYKTDAVYLMVYQTGQDPFRTQLMASRIPGPISARSVIQVSENTHMHLGEDGGLYVFDGTYPRPFSPTIQATIESELDLSYKDRAFLVYTPRLNIVLAMYPTKGSEGVVNRGMYVDMAAQAGWPFEWPGTVFDFTAGAPVQRLQSWDTRGVTVRLGDVEGALDSGQSLQPDFFMGDVSGTTFFQDPSAEDDYGNPISVILRSGLTEFGNLDKFSIMREVEFVLRRTNFPQDLVASIWSSDYDTDARPVANATLQLSEEGPHSMEVREKGRYWGYELRGLMSERLVFSGAYGSLRALGYRKS